ncbi:MAG: 3-hydroxyacyl-CoA dehydrogenase family protein [Candidatus Nanopelagicales bacterium]
MTSQSTDTRIAVIGSGYMGGGMAQVFVMAGYPCVIADASPDIAQESVRRLVDEARDFEGQGLFAAGSASVIAAGLVAADSIESAAAGADYIAEVVPERPDVKREVLGRISDAARTDAVIGTNTSAMPIEGLSAWVLHPERFLGVHWMNPAPFVPCVEIISSTRTNADVIDFAEGLLTALGKVTSRVSDQAGFVANRLQYALFQEATRMVEEGTATPRQIDQVVSNSFGFRLPFFGPFAMADMAGLDVYAGGYESFTRAYGDRFATPRILTERTEAGDLGLKTGGGFTGMDAGRLREIVMYRNRAYARLSELKRELGPVPGS